MHVASWTEWWFVHLAGQTFICLALGLWVSARLAPRPARSQIVIVLGMIAALAAPVASLMVKETNSGLFLGTAEATKYLLAEGGSPASRAPRSATLTDGIVTILGAVSIALLLRIAISYARGRRLIARAEPVIDTGLLNALVRARNAVGLSVIPELRCHESVPSPMIWAWSRTPIALIPAEASARVAEVDWESIFIHELAHVARRDHLIGLFADTAAALLFWNPAAWWARREIARQSEFACDDYVSRLGKSPVEFASALLAMHREALIPRIPAINLTGSRAWVKARVQRLLKIAEPASDRTKSVWTVGAILITGTLVAGLAFCQARLATPPESSFAPPLPELLHRTPNGAPWRR
ncbi:MAG TPA: M56 family metallopeptidase [Gemmataceae bacterium]|jgi:beta-lactamase regulating signal transducer with metallopeptidase domain|nr:M56 family metallopeptidase [Gemmataceae bacterium]